MEEKTMQDTKTSKMVGNAPKKKTIQSILRMGGEIMAAGRQYYKYKAKAEILKNLLFDIKTLLMIDEADPKQKMHTLRCLYTKYERLSKNEKEIA